jgi:serine O-acetyltransferase
VFEKLRADFDRHNRQITNMSIWVLAVYRYGRWAKALPFPLRWPADRMYYALHLGVQITTGSFVPREVELGDAPHFIHPYDIRLHPKVRIGDRVGIMHEVTIATTQHRVGAPVIGNDVFIGPGAKIVGPVTIGDGATIAPNSLVISDVPAGATAIGVPAKARRISLGGSGNGAARSTWNDHMRDPETGHRSNETGPRDPDDDTSKAS